MLNPELKKLQAAYDRYMDEKTLRHNKARRELEEKLYNEDFDALSQIIAQAHELFRSKKALKGDIRRALRQYGNPKFAEMWEMIPFEKQEAKPVETYFIDREDYQITFTRAGWNWDNIPLDYEELTFEIAESENTGKKTLQWGSEQENHAMFNFNNMAEVEGVLENV